MISEKQLATSLVYLFIAINMLHMISEKQLATSLVDLFIAGTDTTSKAIKWAILYLLHNPDIQTKVHEELDRVVGGARIPTLDDRKHLHYAEAFLAEVLRLGSSTDSFAIQHTCDTDTYINDFSIKAGTVIIPNFNSVLTDPELFPDPDKFDPTRFLDIDGKFVNNEKLIPFGIGE